MDGFGIRSCCPSVDDIIFSNGVFFAINITGDIYHCEISPRNPNPKAIPVCSATFRYDPCKKYFAESEFDGLWVVLKKLELTDDCDFTTYFEIYEFNTETKEWTKVSSLTGKPLFLNPQGRCKAVLADESGAKVFNKDNSNDFIDGNPSIGLGPQNLSMFEWESKRITKLLTVCSLHSKF